MGNGDHNFSAKVHLLTLGLKVLWLGGTDNLPLGQDFRLSVPVSGT